MMETPFRCVRLCGSLVRGGALNASEYGNKQDSKI